MPRFFGISKGRNAVYFSLVSPLDPNPDPNYKPSFHMKNHHDRWFVIDLEAAQNSLEFCQTANGSVPCFDTVLAELHSSGGVPRQDHQHQRRIRKVW